MPVYHECRAEIRFDDGSPPIEDDDVEVRIGGGRILLCYWDDRGAVVFEGSEGPDGEFELRARSRPRTARLSHAPGRRLLEGTWSEGDEAGELRIELGEEGESA